MKRFTKLQRKRLKCLKNRARLYGDEVVRSYPGWPDEVVVTCKPKGSPGLKGRYFMKYECTGDIEEWKSLTQAAIDDDE